MIDFSLENGQQVNLAAGGCEGSEGVEVAVNLRFEPSTMMDSRALLTITNPEGGEY